MDLKTITYSEFKNIANTKYNEVPVHFFFSKEQKEKVFKKLNITDENAADKLYKALGGVILKSEKYILNDYFKWFNTNTDILHKRFDFLYQMFYYEFGNHEAHIANSYHDVFKDFVNDEKCDIAISAYKKAKFDHWEYVVKNDLF